MSIRRIVPNIPTSHPQRSREFYADFLGLRLAMDMGWIATYVSPTNPTAQISVARADTAAATEPGSRVTPAMSISVEVEDVNRLHTDAVARGYRIVYPLTDEPFGVRRFAVKDPNGVVVIVMCHIQTAAKLETPG